MTDAMNVFDRRAVRLHRDRAAGTVIDVADILEDAATRLLDRLDDTTHRFTQALDIGGRGVVAPLLRARGIDCVACDLSPRMAARSGTPCVAVDEEWLPFAPGSFDLVVASLSLHWVNDLPGCLIQIRQALRPEGLLLASVPALGSLDELRRALAEAESDLTGGASPRVSPFPDLRDCAGLLQRAGFVMPVADAEPIELLYADPFALLRDLRAAGETNAVRLRDRRPPPAPLFPAALSRLPQAADRVRITPEIGNDDRVEKLKKVLLLFQKKRFLFCSHIAPQQGRDMAELEQHLEAIARHNPVIRAMITVTAPEPGPGLVVSIKDNIDTAGVRTTRGSNFFTDRVPNSDATVVERLRRAGAMIVGKDNLHEFAFGGTTQNPHHGFCRNPWNLDAIPGGSSGGSGAGVAAGFSKVALGTDTGGSVRLPAALNGVTGLRPTVGRISNHGVMPTAARFDTVGPLARSARDVADTYEVIAGYDPRDPYSEDRPVESWRNRHASGFAGLRVGVPSALIAAEATSATASLVRTATAMLTGLGGRTTDIVLPDHDELCRSFMTLVQADAAMVHRDRLASDPGRFGPDILARLKVGAAVPVSDYAAALERQQLWRHEIAAIFRTVDVLAMPTIGFGAPLASEAPDMMRLTHRLTRLAAPWAYALLPALSLPCGLAEGLPIGLQLVGPPWSEALLLALGVAFQEVTSHHTVLPPLLRDGPAA